MNERKTNAICLLVCCCVFVLSDLHFIHFIADWLLLVAAAQPLVAVQRHKIDFVHFSTLFFILIILFVQCFSLSFFSWPPHHFVSLFLFHLFIFFLSFSHALSLFSLSLCNCCNKIWNEMKYACFFFFFVLLFLCIAFLYTYCVRFSFHLFCFSIFSGTNVFYFAHIPYLCFAWSVNCCCVPYVCVCLVCLFVAWLVLVFVIQWISINTQLFTFSSGVLHLKPFEITNYILWSNCYLV